jgi:two-component system, NarL family, sensor histidine kinase UhpB
MFGRRLSLKQRLMLLITALMALLCVAGGVYIVIRAQNDIRGEVRSATDLIQRYLRAQLAVSELSWQKNNDLLPRLELSQLHDVRHVQVFFYTNAGALLETSADAQLQKHRAPLWFSWAVQRSFAPIADSTQAVAFDGVKLGYVVIHPDPTYEMDEIWNVARGLLGLLVAFFVLVSSFIWWAVASAMRPLERVRDALQGLGAGDLTTRLPRFDLPELASLSREFNRTADTLADSTAENRRLTQRLIQTQEEERTRIAHELHDEIGQCVTAIHADAVAIQRANPDAHGGADADVRESASAIVDAAAQIKDLVRGMLQRLRPAPLGGMGLASALREQVAMFRQRNPEVVCNLHVDARAANLEGELARVVYRLVQEALTNISRHARASNVSIDVALRKLDEQMLQNENMVFFEGLDVTIDDDGEGFDVGVRNGGYGLAGMRERAQALGGSLHIDSRRHVGTRINARLPWTSSAISDGAAP